MKETSESDQNNFLPVSSKILLVQQLKEQRNSFWLVKDVLNIPVKSQIIPDLILDDLVWIWWFPISSQGSAKSFSHYRNHENSFDEKPFPFCFFLLLIFVFFVNENKLH